MHDLRDDLTEHHPQINLVNFDLYDVRVIPVEWDHIMPVGILCSPRPTEVVRRFLSAPEIILTSPKENAR